MQVGDIVVNKRESLTYVGYVVEVSEKHARAIELVVAHRNYLGQPELFGFHASATFELDDPEYIVLRPSTEVVGS
jgi:hypothetical protein